MLKVMRSVVIMWKPDLGQYTAFMFSDSNSTAATNATVSYVDRPVLKTAALGQAMYDWQQDVYSTNPALDSMICGLVAPLSSVDSHWAVDKRTRQQKVSPALGRWQ
eukprot:GHRR01015132.1.p2 GENE.GHRR01015132.1~~GHRR01015132.1.p2  ORF type:complete len:106 (+),score=31.28 GHRR01015132.1:644-961(+)